MKKVNKKRSFIVVEDSYHYYGLWLKGMMEVQPDGLLRNITRGNSEHVEHVINICNLCSTRDARDIDLYRVFAEKNLVYYDEKAEIDKIDGKIILKNICISLTFCKDSETLIDRVIQKLREEGRDIKEIKVKTRETFLIPEEEAISVVEDFTGCILNPETYELTQVDNESKCCFSCSITKTDKNEDDIPF